MYSVFASRAHELPYELWPLADRVAFYAEHTWHLYILEWRFSVLTFKTSNNLLQLFGHNSNMLSTTQ